MPTHTVLEALQSIAPTHGGTVMRVFALFGDQPEVLAAIVDARRRRCSYAQIAKAISTPEATISDAAVKKYLLSLGVE